MEKEKLYFTNLRNSQIDNLIEKLNALKNNSNLMIFCNKKEYLKNEIDAIFNTAAQEHEYLSMKKFFEEYVVSEENDNIEFKVGDKVIKNEKTWVTTKYDKYGRGEGVGTIEGVPTDLPDKVRVAWPYGTSLEFKKHLIKYN